MSAVAQHNLETGHKIEFDATTVLNKASSHWDLVIKEAKEIQLDGNNINRDWILQMYTNNCSSSDTYPIVKLTKMIKVDAFTSSTMVHNITTTMKFVGYLIGVSLGVGLVVQGQLHGHLAHQI
ncbi:hypothetical protein ANN_14488 [Periplaneta americana]|uniref:Uncharacterized protein n=1 Tax=Periplaneta americana TaxID=6978 RepID=A0ABQ8SXT7_PERAM|nr:hypothetical protein ANN_14488 [Periplaneta americana]